VIGRWDAYVSFSEILYLVRMRREEEDKLWWVPFKRGLFGVKSFCNVIGCHDGSRCLWKSGRVFGGLRFRSVWPFCVVCGLRKDPYYG
jgi:hypothetical protein